MNWQNLSYFHEVAKYQNFSHAAKELYITPSALNKAVHALEEEIGIPLFERKGRNSYLTSYGKILYECLTEAYASIDVGLQKIYELINFVSGRVRVDGIYTMCIDYLPDKVREFKSRYPNVEFTIDYHITNRILENIVSGSSDLGFCGDYEVEKREYADIEKVLLMQEELVLIVPAGNTKWEKVSRVEFEQLSKEEFVTYKNVNSGINYIFRKMCKEAGFNPKVAFEVSDDTAIVRMVSNGLGIALVPVSLEIPGDQVIAIPFQEDQIPYRNQYMIWNGKRYMSPPVREFRDFITEFVEE